MITGREMSTEILGVLRAPWKNLVKGPNSVILYKAFYKGIPTSP
jgi:hypothetical protein